MEIVTLTAELRGLENLIKRMAAYHKYDAELLDPKTPTEETL